MVDTHSVRACKCTIRCQLSKIRHGLVSVKAFLYLLTKLISSVKFDVQAQNRVPPSPPPQSGEIQENELSTSDGPVSWYTPWGWRRRMPILWEGLRSRAESVLRTHRRISTLNSSAQKAKWKKLKLNHGISYGLLPLGESLAWINNYPS